MITCQNSNLRGSSLTQFSAGRRLLPPWTLPSITVPIQSFCFFSTVCASAYPNHHVAGDFQGCRRGTASIGGYELDWYGLTLEGRWKDFKIANVQHLFQLVEELG
jgi:hypothetical protein